MNNQLDPPTVHMGATLLGDALMTLPAIEALSLHHGCRIPVTLEEVARPLFQDNPHIKLLPPGTSPTEPFIAVSPGPAFEWGFAHHAHMCAGFFPVLGLPPDLAAKPRLYLKTLDRIAPICNSICPGVTTKNDIYEPGKYITIAPFSRSCSVHTINIANKTRPVSWWVDSILKIQKELGPDISIFTLGSATDPEIPGAINWRGVPITNVCRLMKHAAVNIVGDTGLMHVAGALDAPTLWLRCASPESLVGPRTRGTYRMLSAVGPTWPVKSIIDALPSFF